MRRGTVAGADQQKLGTQGLGEGLRPRLRGTIHDVVAVSLMGLAKANQLI